MTTEHVNTTRTLVRQIPPGAVIGVTGALSAVLVFVITAPASAPSLRYVFLLAALLMLPIDVLPVIMVMTVRIPATVIGPLNASDVVALIYLARLTSGGRLLGLQVSRSRIALLLFLIWAAVTTAAGVGLYTALCHIALYAVVGMAVTYRPQARTLLFVGIVGFALMDVILYLPSFPARLWGVLIDDPTHAGTLLLGALLVVSTSRLPMTAKVSLGGLLGFGIVMTLTRSIWFATGAVAIAALLPRRWYVPILLPPALAAFTLPWAAAITSRLDLNPYSAVIRQQSMSIGLQEFARHPFFGRGWMFTSAAREFGLTGTTLVPTYNLWIYLGACVGIVGIALFGIFIALLAREVADDTAAYLALVGSLAISLSEMPFYAGSLIALLLFMLTSARSDRTSRDPVSTGEPGPIPR
jgi:hypothetical protein